MKQLPLSSWQATTVRKRRQDGEFTLLSGQSAIIVFTDMTRGFVLAIGDISRMALDLRRRVFDWNRMTCAS